MGVCRLNERKDLGNVEMELPCGHQSEPLANDQGLGPQPVTKSQPHWRQHHNVADGEILDIGGAVVWVATKPIKVTTQP